MTIRLQEVVRSEVEGGLSGPANPIPSQSIDCGCAQLPCPKLAKFATRRLFVGLMTWIGLVQAAGYAYFYVAGPTIARRFQFDPYIMEWVLVISDLTPFFLGLLVAYWGDRFHRVAWIGGVVLLQSVSYFIMIIPHLTHKMKFFDNANNVTHMSKYADDHKELCSAVPFRIIAKDDEFCYFTFGMIIGVQVVSGVAQIAYFALGISYLDDNTKKKHAAAFIGIIIAVKIVGVLLGYILAWGCLRIDAETLTTIDSYTDQIGAWWLGFPILTILLVVPSLLLSWFPRVLPSEVVEQAAASLLISASRYNLAPKKAIKVGGAGFCETLNRLFLNKILVCHVLAFTLSIMAIVNFMGYENLIIESKFHVPKPTGMLLGFNDPMPSRLISNFLKPILIGLIVTVTGLVISKAKPSARSVIGYSVVVVTISAAIIFGLTGTVCEKNPIVGTDDRGRIDLTKYCNKDCGCSDDAQFHPVCDPKGQYTFYSPCHAGCASSEFKNGITMYTGCTCVQEVTGKADGDAQDGPCNSSVCQIGWLFFEFGTLLAYALVASAFVGDCLITLRSVYAQDKACSIGFLMMWSTIFTYAAGKFVYDLVASLTCQYWGTQKTICHLHDSLKLGDYLCYLTGSLLALSALLKILSWIFCADLDLYNQEMEELPEGAELQVLVPNLALSSRKAGELSDTGNNDKSTTRAEIVNKPETTKTNENSGKSKAQQQIDDAPLKYGPLGPGDRRTDSKSSLNKISKVRNLETEDELSSSDEVAMKNLNSKVPYVPLDLDSDVESDLSNAEPRSRKRIHSKDYDRVYDLDQSSSEKSSFPRQNPGRTQYKNQKGTADGSYITSSFEYSSKQNGASRRGDFNEVGIPIVSYSPQSQSDPRFLKDVKSLINQYELNADHQVAEDQQVEAGVGGHHTDYKPVAGIPLAAMVQSRPESRNGQFSSGFSSLAGGRAPQDRPESRESSSPRTSSKGSRGTLHTDF
ncbi:solute carrier organic anion transporter family member 3A1 [Hylaeus anthracinus]|uniref:solute carrier organic anion transporter family member 3A1 n=1 Tax=Hylaeus anthracinus TaxID=313031 RepID=UPI0023B900B1|nr:solute carrier organic anion transporter family member 3A1 [Hylaeus anthracinus]